MTGQLKRIAAVLASLDIGRTVGFCEGRLGFRCVAQHEDYAIFQRDEISVHYWLCSDRYIAQNTSCYVYVSDARSLYAEYQEQGIIHPNGPLRQQPWGLEFAVLDLDGNLYKFCEPN
ncbi:MAG: hypothetical protein OXF44_07580 [Anaerolineaceae bacterium]|nr:hypothetical protein [Anaerolineaceae bacterium]